MSPDSGMAAAIGAVMICMVITPAVVLGAVGFLITRKQRAWIKALATLLGFGVGGLIGPAIVVFTFYEDTYSAPRVEVIVPGDFAHEWVVLIEDARVSQEIELSGIPPSTRIHVPANGVLRVRSLGDLAGRGDARYTLSNGASNYGMSSRSLPSALGGGRMLALSFAQAPGTEPDLGMLEDAELADRIRALEAER